MNEQSTKDSPVDPPKVDGSGVDGSEDDFSSPTTSSLINLQSNPPDVPEDSSQASSDPFISTPESSNVPHTKTGRYVLFPKHIGDRHGDKKMMISITLLWSN